MVRYMTLQQILQKHQPFIDRDRQELAKRELRRDTALSGAAKNAITASSLSLRKFATLMGVSAPYLSDVLRLNRGWNDDVITKFDAATRKTARA